MVEVSNKLSSTIETGSNESLDELKKTIIKETVEEIFKDRGLFSGTKKKLLNKYLSKEGDPLEVLEDYFIENLLEKDISEPIKKFKDDVIKSNTIEELNKIKSDTLSQKKSDNQDTVLNTAVTTSGIAATTINSNAEQRDTNTPHKKTKHSSTERYAIDEFDIDVTQKYENLYNKLKGPELPDLEPFACAMKGYEEMKNSLKNPTYLTVVDFTKPNDENRFYVINMTNNTIEYATTVGHGSGSGKGKFAKSFSDVNGSYQSSLGFFRTPDDITKPNSKKRNGLLMKGIEDSNDSAQSRGIYMHPGGSISQGCFTLPKDQAYEIMNKLKGDSLLFAYAKSNDYFAQSEYFDSSSNGDIAVA